MTWYPNIYEKFKKQRYLPFEDSFSMIDVREGLNVIDLGCGTGELTERLAKRLPKCQVVGMDNSPEMLEEAIKRQSHNLKFVKEDLRNIDGTWDLVFSSSAIQWISDHKSLFLKIFSKVADNGQVVIQFPAHFDHPIQVLLREIAHLEPFTSVLGGWYRYPELLTLEEYADIMYSYCGENISVSAKIYPHLLSGVDQIVEWAKGTSLLPYIEKLPSAMHKAFFDCYRNGLERLYGGGSVLYAFRRVLISGKRRG